MYDPDYIYLTDEEINELTTLSNMHDIISDKMFQAFDTAPNVPLYSLYLSIQVAEISMKIIRLIRPKIHQTEQDYASLTSKNKLTIEYCNMSLHAQNDILFMRERIESETFPHHVLDYHEYCLKNQLKEILPKQGEKIW